MSLQCARWARTHLVLAGLAATCAGCKETPAPLAFSLPAPDGRGRVQIALPQLAVLDPPSTATLCAGAGPPPARSLGRKPYAQLRAIACASPAADRFGDFLDLANGDAPETKEGRMATIAAVVESMRNAETADDARTALNFLGVRLREDGTALGVPQFYVASGEAFDRAAAFCPKDEAACRRDIFLKAGKAFVEAGRWHGDTEALHQAIGFLERARAVTPADDVAETTSVLNELGNAYSYESELLSGQRERDDLEAAATVYERALPALDKAPKGFDWAMVHHNLGTVFDRWNKIDPAGAARDAHLDRAIAEFEAALTVWTRDKEPSAWADANDNLGASVFRRGAQRGIAADLDRGIAILRDALAMRTARKAADPLPWAYSTLALAGHLLDRAEITAAARPAAARTDRDEARRLLAACEPTLRAAKASHYLARWELQSRRLAGLSHSAD